MIVGMFVQFVVALFVLRSGAGCRWTGEAVQCAMLTVSSDDIFSFISELARDLLGFANQGTTFLTDETVPALGWFIVGVLRKSRHSNTPA